MWLDLVVANRALDSISVFLGSSNGTFENHIDISTGSSHPIWIHIAYIENDPSLDIITANYGTNNLQIRLQTC
jgi:hypothetical protein